MSGAGKPGPGYEFKAFRHSSHYWILKILQREKSSIKILDVGTAGGYLGRILTARGHSVTGIEKDPVTAEAARDFYDSFQVADLEIFEFPYRRQFDYIVFADVLEHLRDPAAVLRSCIPALKENGKIVISVPNVANVLVRLSLLFGRFEYTDRGILDRTHFRFFTLRSLKKTTSEVSCSVVEVIPTPLPVQIVFPFTENKWFAPFHGALYALTRCWKTLFAYQFVIVLKPRGPSVPVDSGEEIFEERMLANK